MGVPPISTVRPTIPGSPPNRRCHSSQLSIVACGSPNAPPPGAGSVNTASSGRKLRPSSGFTPSTSIRLGVAPATVICSGSPSPPVSDC